MINLIKFSIIFKKPFHSFSLTLNGTNQNIINCKPNDAILIWHIKIYYNKIHFIFTRNRKNVEYVGQNIIINNMKKKNWGCVFLLFHIIGEWVCVCSHNENNEKKKERIDCTNRNIAESTIVKISEEKPHKNIKR